MSKQYQESPDVRPSRDEFAIGIPAYNEVEAVGDVVQSSLEVTDTVIVVDDGSDDGTAERARAAGADVISHDENSGYGAALSTLFESADSRDVDHLVILDADGQHDPSDAPDLVATQQTSEAEVVIGSRFVSGSQSDTPLYRRVGLAVINFIVGAGLKLGYSSSAVYDTQSGFRAYDATATEMLAQDADLSDGMDASVDILFHAAAEGYEFVELPVDVTYDVAEANTHNPIVHGSVLMQNVLSRVVSDRPKRTLGVPGAVSILSGAALGSSLFSGAPFLRAVPTLVVLLLIAMGSGLTGVAFVLDRARPRGD